MEKTCVYLSSSILTPALTMPSPCRRDFCTRTRPATDDHRRGNVSVEKTTRNALQLLHFWNAEIPLAQGAAVPLVRAPRDAASVHGESGMAGYDFVEHNRKPLGYRRFWRFGMP
ncbi:nucleoside hydrolase [Escherichia coli]